MPPEAKQSESDEMSSHVPKSWRQRCRDGVLAILVAFTIGYFARGFILDGILETLIGGGLITLVVSFVSRLIIRLFMHRWPQRTKWASLMGVATLALLVLMLVFSLSLERGDFESAKSYPTMADSSLEQYKQMHGKYPKTLAEIPALPSLPRGLVYCGIEEDYLFSFPYGGLFSSYVYSSKNRVWLWLD